MIAGIYILIAGAVLTVPLGLVIQTTIPFPIQFGASLGVIGGLCWGGFVEYSSQYTYIRGAVCGAFAGIATTGMWLVLLAFVITQGKPLEALSAGSEFLLETLFVVGIVGGCVLGFPLIYLRRRQTSEYLSK